MSGLAALIASAHRESNRQPSPAQRLTFAQHVQGTIDEQFSIAWQRKAFRHQQPLTEQAIDGMQADRCAGRVHGRGKLPSVNCITQRLVDAAVAFHAVSLSLLALIAHFIGELAAMKENFGYSAGFRIQRHPLKQRDQQLAQAAQRVDLIRVLAGRSQFDANCPAWP